MQTEVCIAIIIAVILVIIVFPKFKSEYDDFISGMWSNSKEGIYVYIDDKVKNGTQGGYIVSEDTSINEPFKMKVGKINMDTRETNVEINGSTFLAKKFKMKLDLPSGRLQVEKRNGKKIQLYRDNETSESMKNGEKNSTSSDADKI